MRFGSPMPLVVEVVGPSAEAKPTALDRVVEVIAVVEPATLGAKPPWYASEVVVVVLVTLGAKPPW